MEQKKHSNRFNRDFKMVHIKKKKKTLKENLGKGKNSVSFWGLSCYHPQCFPLRVSAACTKGMVTVNYRKS